MAITYHDDADFYAGIQQLVKQGLTFTADHFTLTVKLTGGY